MIQNFSDQFIKDLSNVSKEEIYGPGKTIYNENEQEDRIFIIVTGNIE